MFNEEDLQLALEAQTTKMAAARLPSVSRRRSASRLQGGAAPGWRAGGQVAPAANRRVAS
jgi:hypothetical protein